MKLDWGKAEGAVDESAFALGLTNLNLADWRAFLGTNVVAGLVNLDLRLLSQQAGRKLQLNLTGQLADLAARFGPSQLDHADVSFTVRGQVDGFARVQLSEYRLQLRRQQQAAFTVNGSGAYDVQKQDADLQMQMEMQLPGMMQILAMPDLAVSSGVVQFTGRVVQKNLTPNLTTNASLQHSVVGNIKLSDLSGRYGTYVVDRWGAQIDADLGLKDDLLELRKLAGTLQQGAALAGEFGIQGRYHLKKQAGELAVSLNGLTQGALRPFLADALGDKTLASVYVSANTKVLYDAKGESGISGEVHLANLLVSDPKKQLPTVPLSFDLKVDGTFARGVAELRQLTGSFRQADKPAGSFEAVFKHDLTNQVGQVNLKLSGVNQNALQPFLAATLGDKTLASVAMNGTVAASYDLKRDSTAKADLEIADLVVRDPAGRLPKTPLAARVQLDAQMNKQVLDLRQLRLALTPTAKAKNEVQIMGKVDFTKTNAITGNLKLSAESLDLTRYYDLFAGPQGATAGTPQTATKPLSKPAEVEPPATQLPFQKFQCDALIGRLFLRNLTITNLLATARIDGGRVQIKPLQLSLNGAPVSGSADLNLGVPGYTYDVAFTADKVPVEPVVDSFLPSWRGQCAGTFVANAQVKGAGITGASLQKSLSGRVGMTFTNANIQVFGPKAKGLITPLAVVLGMQELTQTPLNWVNVSADLGNGKIDLKQCAVASEAFYADTAGAVPIARVLNDSPLNLPVNVALRRSLAQKANLIPANAPTNTAYVQLPAFAKLTGTLGDPKTETDKLVISGLLLRSVSGISGVVGRVGGKAGSTNTANLLEGIGNLLTGGAAAAQQPAQTTSQAPAAVPAATGTVKPAPTPAPAPIQPSRASPSPAGTPPAQPRSVVTNQPVQSKTNQPAQVTPADVLRQLLERSRTTNRPPATTPPK